MRHLLLGLILLAATAPSVAASDAGTATPAPSPAAGVPEAPAVSPTAAVSVAAIEAQIRHLDSGLRQLVAQREQAQRQLDASERAITETLAVIGGLQAALRLQSPAGQ